CPVPELWRRIIGSCALAWPCREQLRGAAAGPSAGVGAFGVVVAQVAFQIQPQAGLLGDEVAGKGRLPALVQDGLLHPLDAAVGLRAAGPEEAVAGAEGSDCLLEGGRAELLGVVSHDPLQTPAPLSQVGGDGAGELAGPLGWGAAAGHNR